MLLFKTVHGFSNFLKCPEIALNPADPVNPASEAMAADRAAEVEAACAHLAALVEPGRLANSHAL